MDASGHVVIPDAVRAVESRAAIYARVSSAESKSNLDAQAERVAQYAIARGWRVARVVKEVGSGGNDHRKRLQRLLTDGSWDILVVRAQGSIDPVRIPLPRYGAHRSRISASRSSIAPRMKRPI